MSSSSIRKEFIARRVLATHTRVVMHSHGSEYRSYWNAMPHWQRDRTMRIFSRVSALIVLGEVWRDFFSSIGVPRDRLFVMPNPVALPAALPERRGRPTVQFAHLGIIGRRKGAFDLIEAIRLIRPQDLQRCRFIVAGDGEVNRLRAMVEELNLEKFVDVRGWVDSVERDRILAESDSFILPSYDEGLPMALLEAMAWGLPPICTPVGSIAEVVADNRNGLLITPGDVPALAAAIVRISRNAGERQAFAQAARETVEPLSVSNYMNRLVSLYGRVCATSRRIQA